MGEVTNINNNINLEDLNILTVDDVAKKLKVNPIDIKRLVKSNKIPVTRVGGESRFVERQIVTWILNGGAI